MPGLQFPIWLPNRRHLRLRFWNLPPNRRNTHTRDAHSRSPCGSLKAKANHRMEDGFHSARRARGAGFLNDLASTVLYGRAQWREPAVGAPGVFASAFVG